MFVDRQTELEQLDQLYHSGRAELFVLYGRRRVGKTELLRAFCKEKPAIFFIATLSADSQQLATFSQQIYAFDHADVPEGFTFPTWEAAFLALADLPHDPRPVIVLDEFTYLISGNKAIPSILQKVWDQTLKDSQIMLVLCGSYIGMMESEVLGYQAPLYGRRTASTLLQPLNLPTTSLFYPAFSPQQRIEAWSVLGGMPYYLRLFSDTQSIENNICRHILNPNTGTLFSEPRLLLMEELREPRNYFSILRAIAQGRTRLNEISQASGVGSPNTVARYLDILQQMHLITRRLPATEKQPHKSKKGIYQINDHFLRFWFRYVHPNQASLDLGLTDAVWQQRIQTDLDHFVAAAFEEAARTHVARLARQGKLAFLPDSIGAWWNRMAEVDVVAISHADKTALIGECKWSVKPVGLSVLHDLKKKAQFLTAENELQQVRYALFSRAGFTEELEAQAYEEDIWLFTPQELVSLEVNEVR